MELEQGASPNTTPIPASQTTKLQAGREDAEAHATIMAKEKCVMELAESKIERLRFELRQSSDREVVIRAKGRKATKTLQEKVDVEVTAHKRTLAELNKQREDGAKKDGIITSL